VSNNPSAVRTRKAAARGQQHLGDVEAEDEAEAVGDVNAGPGTEPTTEVPRM
jgi:hypothetical protein